MSSADPRESVGRRVCVHGHFYQPPRENPWLEAIEIQDSAYPYHDWNERITAECYAPNAASRILDEQDRIVEITNNYSRISFNFGPTLLSWLERRAPRSTRRSWRPTGTAGPAFRGHGSAIAQAYNHVILPLANPRDKRTQVLWGIRDFEPRFGRFPEGMWLPETAVDVESLEILAEQGIRFTILAPTRPARWRPPGGSLDRIGGRGHRYLDAVRGPPPLGPLASPSSSTTGRSRRRSPSRGCSRTGTQFARRLARRRRGRRRGRQLVHIATDGETYGHHHRYGDMALAYALRVIESSESARLTNYGEFLERFRPRSRSRSGRTRPGAACTASSAGAATAAAPGAEPRLEPGLARAAAPGPRWLRDAVARPFEEAAGRLLRDPWAARDEYIGVVLDRSAGQRDAVPRGPGARPARPRRNDAPRSSCSSCSATRC